MQNSIISRVLPFQRQTLGKKEPLIKPAENITETSFFKNDADKNKCNNVNGYSLNNGSDNEIPFAENHAC